MSVRETMEQKKTLALTIAVIAILLAGAAIAYQALHWRSGPRAGELFFTTDDGKTWFTGPEDQFPPFEHSGKTAVQAVVWECDGKQFVSNLVRYTPEGKKKATALRTGSDPALMQELAGGVSWREVKKPGAPESEWVGENDPRAQEIRTPTPPPGCTGTPTKVRP